VSVPAKRILPGAHDIERVSLVGRPSTAATTDKCPVKREEPNLFHSAVQVKQLPDNHAFNLAVVEQVAKLFGAGSHFNPPDFCNERPGISRGRKFAVKDCARRQVLIVNSDR
jgi:hypothetical protein